MPLYVPEPFLPGPGDGQPGNLALPGSGFAVPAGVEVPLQYNGLILNVQGNVDRYRVDSIDGLYDADVRDTRDSNTNDDGETPYNSFYGGRTIVINGTILTYQVSKLRDMQQALRAAFADIRNEYPLQFRTGDYTKDHIIYCKKINAINGTEQQANQNMSRAFQISLRASNPRYLSYYSKFIDETPPGAISADNPFAFPVAQNNGNYWAQPIYQIFGPSQQGVTITNDDTGDSFTINGPIAYGDYVIFDTTSPGQSLKNSKGDNMWNQLSDDSDYVSFQGVSETTDGSNNLFYYGDASRVQISWRDTWI